VIQDDQRAETAGSEHCYCFLWETKPEHFEQQGVPRGYCGLCDICGAPGHTRPHPGAPATGAWCDACFAQLAHGVPLWKVIRVALIALAIGSIAIAVWQIL